MLRMLLVEDEKLELEGLLNFLDWPLFGVEIAGTARDGFEGLEKAALCRPDIIITDIKMPGMDGLVMSKKVKEFLPGARIIILTGYDDFRMAKEAISLNVSAYVLKPLEEDEMAAVLKRVAAECRRDQEKAEAELSVKRLLDTSMKLARSKFLSDLLEGKTGAAEAEARFAEFGIKIRVRSGYTAAIIKLAELAGFDSHSGDAGLRDVLHTASGIFGDSLAFTLEDEKKTQAVLCLTQPEFGKFRELCDAAGAVQGNGIIIGIGGAFPSADGIAVSYAQACQSAEFGVFWSVPGITSYDRVDSLRSEFVETAGEFLVKNSYFLKQLVHAVRSCDETRLSELLAEMFAYIRSEQGAGRELTVNCLQNLVNETSLILYTTNRDFSFAGMYGEDIETQLARLPDLGSMEERIYCFFKDAFDFINDKKANRDGDIIKKVIRLVEERYMSDISLKLIAREVYLSPNYLGTIFRKHTGSTFNDFLSEYRLEKAKELLASPKNRVGWVAGKVGIPNTSYFCTIFKDRFGIAPGEYQESLLRK